MNHFIQFQDDLGNIILDKSVIDSHSLSIVLSEKQFTINDILYDFVRKSLILGQNYQIMGLVSMSLTFIIVITKSPVQAIKQSTK
jgi:hypothetical protein